MERAQRISDIISKREPFVSKIEAVVGNLNSLGTALRRLEEQTSLPISSKNEIVLVRYPFSDLTGSKVRPAVVVNAPHPSQDLIIVPLTSRTTALLRGEFVLAEWKRAGLNIETAVKRGLYTIDQKLVRKSIGTLLKEDAEKLERALHDVVGSRV